MNLSQLAHQGLIAAAALWIAAPLALAQQDATYSLGASTSGHFNSNQPVSGTITGPFTSLETSASGNNSLYTGSASGMVTLTGGADPTLALQASDSGSGYFSGATGTLTYYFEVLSTIGNPGYAPIKMDITGTFTQSLGAVSNGSAYIGFGISPSYSNQTLFQTMNGQYALDNWTPYGSGSPSSSGSIAANQSISIDQTFYVYANTVYDIYMTGSVSAQFGASPDSVTIDPNVTLDPTFASANPTATLEFSSGFSAVPEPPNVALWSGVLALCAVGFLMARRQCAAA